MFKISSMQTEKSPYKSTNISVIGIGICCSQNMCKSVMPIREQHVLYIFSYNRRDDCVSRQFSSLLLCNNYNSTRTRLQC